ncbi:hypothetical protein Hypma_010805 [Hypsizygus marmoreus]|uniref:Uncharacterized protein n=1 Tax=Hypsizygus marmoreus TaxID=39966 RepID=A0A369JQ81_HYPMA|nr:hypothetical protein Hypma_010805 [Hypsizygus marmoreus]
MVTALHVVEADALTTEHSSNYIHDVSVCHGTSWMTLLTGIKDHLNVAAFSTSCAEEQCRSARVAPSGLDGQAAHEMAC